MPLMGKLLRQPQVRDDGGIRPPYRGPRARRRRDGRCREAGIVADARLDDLRHTHVLHAVMNGENMHVAGWLLWHRRANMTNCYVHLDDATLGEPAERVAATVAAAMHGLSPRRG